MAESTTLTRHERVQTTMTDGATFTWHGYSYAGDPGYATGYGELHFQSETDLTRAEGWLADNTRQHNRLIAIRPVIGTLPGAIQIYWASNAQGEWFIGPGQIETKEDKRIITFNTPTGELTWVLEPGQ